MSQSSARHSDSCLCAANNLVDVFGKPVGSLHDCSNPELPNGYETTIGIFGRTLLKRDSDGKAELLAFGCSRTGHNAVINLGIYAAEARNHLGETSLFNFVRGLYPGWGTTDLYSL